MVSEVLATVLVAIGLIAALCTGLNYAAGVACHAKWEDSPYQSKYSFLAGCRVSSDGVYWLPAATIREW